MQFGLYCRGAAKNDTQLCNQIVSFSSKRVEVIQMDDRKIVELYWTRSEQAICETPVSYTHLTLPTMAVV